MRICKMSQRLSIIKREREKIRSTDGRSVNKCKKEKKEKKSE